MNYVMMDQIVRQQEEIAKLRKQLATIADEVRKECAQVCEQNAVYKKQIPRCGSVSMKTVNVLFKTAIQIREMKWSKP